MLACVIFGALAGVFSAVFALRQGIGFAESFAIYVTVSVVTMLGIPLLLLLRTWLMTWVLRTQRQVAARVWNG